jgi:hypothetical protein
VKAALMGREVVSENIDALISCGRKPEDFGSTDFEELSFRSEEGIVPLI